MENQEKIGELGLTGKRLSATIIPSSHHPIIPSSHRTRRHWREDSVRLPSQWRQWAVFMLLAPTASLAAYHLGSLTSTGLKQQEQRRQPPTINGLFVEPQSLDLGEVSETPRHTFRLTIQNRGSAARTISRFQTTCGCLQLDPSRQTIAPGATAEFTGNLDLMHRRPYQVVRPNGRFRCVSIPFLKEILRPRLAGRRKVLFGVASASTLPCWRLKIDVPREERESGARSVPRPMCRLNP